VPSEGESCWTGFPGGGIVTCGPGSLNRGVTCGTGSSTGGGGLCCAPTSDPGKGAAANNPIATSASTGVRWGIIANNQFNSGCASSHYRSSVLRTAPSQRTVQSRASAGPRNLGGADRVPCPLENPDPSAHGEAAGRVAERLKAAVLKTARARKGPRGFESHPFRQHAVSAHFRALPVPAGYPLAAGMYDTIGPGVCRTRARGM
jgi:hypothetical protein